MKYFSLFLLTAILMFSSCKKDKEETRFDLLTGPTWESDSLLVNGVDAGSPGGFLEDFNGDVKFNRDGTGSFGDFTGTWTFTASETKLIITTTELPLPLTTDIVELTGNSLKISTVYLASTIRMTFKAKE